MAWPVNSLGGGGALLLGSKVVHQVQVNEWCCPDFAGHARKCSTSMNIILCFRYPIIALLNGVCEGLGCVHGVQLWLSFCILRRT